MSLSSCCLKHFGIFKGFLICLSDFGLVIFFCIFSIHISLCSLDWLFYFETSFLAVWFPVPVVVCT